MSNSINRRHFLLGSAGLAASAAMAGTSLAAEQQRPRPSDRIRLGIVGCAHRGAANLNGVAREEIVALCDVDTNNARAARQRFPRARFYEDYRRLIDCNDIDAVVVSTPDHLHAFVTVAALQSGKHVYCEKPLTHSVHEAQVVLRTAARHNNLKTQMGTQIHAGNNYRRVVELVQSGAIGQMRRVHVWCSTRPQPGHRAQGRPQTPAGLNYDLWLGPAPYRPYDESHLHFRWRWWWDFGGGVMADMACHYMDLPHWALHLSEPTSVRATGRKLYEGDNNVPSILQVDYQYPARGNAPPVHLTWYHGVRGPNLNDQVHYPGYPSGVLFEGERGQLLAKYGDHRLLPEERFRDFQRPPQTIAPSIGHHREWLEAIRNNGTTTCNFGYSGPLALTVLLGNVAYRSGEALQWDSSNGRVTNTQGADQYIQREYRRGWRLS